MDSSCVVWSKCHGHNIYFVYLIYVCYRFPIRWNSCRISDAAAQPVRVSHCQYLYCALLFLSQSLMRFPYWLGEYTHNMILILHAHHLCVVTMSHLTHIYYSLFYFLLSSTCSPKYVIHCWYAVLDNFADQNWLRCVPNILGITDRFMPKHENVKILYLYRGLAWSAWGCTCTSTCVYICVYVCAWVFLFFYLIFFYYYLTVC